jgi:hypothetical protein
MLRKQAAKFGILNGLFSQRELFVVTALASIAPLASTSYAWW